jgi:hypothetical protein
MQYNAENGTLTMKLIFPHQHALPLKTIPLKDTTGLFARHWLALASPLAPAWARGLLRIRLADACACARAALAPPSPVATRAELALSLSKGGRRDEGSHG